MSFLNREDALKKIADGLALLGHSIHNRGILGLRDANIIAESFFASFLNCYYDLNLTNLNLIRSNFPAIDLGDTNRRVCYQITSEKSNKKIQDTIDKFISNNLYNQYDELFVVIMQNKLGNHPPFETHNRFTFNANKHVTDLDDLVKGVQHLSLSKLQSLAQIIDSEIVGLNQEKALLGQSDREALETYKAVFSRPALDDSFKREDFKNFKKALSDLIYFVNAGKIDKSYVAKPRSKFTSHVDDLNEIYRKLANMQGLLNELIGSGQINIRKNKLNLIDSSVISIFDDEKRAIKDILNGILRAEGLGII